MLKEFKAFAMRGNVVDMAVGIIIGTAFGKIVTSLVNDIIMPPIGVLLGRVDFSKYQFILQAATEQHDAVTLNYGLFINTVVNFIIVAFAVFILISQINKLHKKAEAKPSTKECPLCCSKISINAIRCPACTAHLTGDS